MQRSAVSSQLSVSSFKASGFELRAKSSVLETRNLELELESLQLLQISLKISASLGHRVAAEFFQRAPRQRKGDHGLAGNSGRGHDTNIRALVRCLHRFAGGEVH